MAKLLYKYLDAKGGLAMLKNHNLQFTNAAKLNDPFDCHPSLIDFSNVPAERCRVWDSKTIEILESEQYKRQWRNTWICSLSKTFDNLLMWAHYCINHQGVCISIDIEKANKYLSKIPNGVYIGAKELEVQYEEIIRKPDFFHDFSKNFFRYQLSTKAKDWEYEQEVRLVLNDPLSAFTPMARPIKPKKNNEWEGYRAYALIGGECFSELYLGINISKRRKSNLVKVARELNPNIKIYQMVRDLEKFSLSAISIN